ncbi:MAG: ABC transporter ATP-binding protein/permease [Treponema sp.]|jgi:ATP-binding cassette subfamily B protein|nr:ABC transporter ATP-binding protein/permease [Treponema sp.]
MADSYFDTDDITKEYDSRIVRRILSYLKPYKHLAIMTIAALVVSTLGELALPVLLQRIIDDGILVKNVSFLAQGCVFYLILLVFVFAFTFAQTWTANLMTQRVLKDIRIALFTKTIRQSTGFLSRHPVGRIVTRLTSDVQTMDEFFTTVLVAFMKDIAVMAGTLVTLFILSPKLALVVLLTLPPVLIITFISRVKARDAFRRQRTASSKVYAYLAERLSGMQVVQLFRQEKKSLREFRESNQELLGANLGEMYVFATFRPAVEWLSTFTMAVVIVAGSGLTLSLSLSLGALIAFINLVQMFYQPVTDIAEKYTMLQSAMAGGEKIFKLMDTEEHIADNGNIRTEGLVQGSVEFNDVNFAYKQGENVLKSLSFFVKPGEMAAIVGYTGAGKTTIINILTRLWDIETGDIKLDGHSIKDILLEDLRASIMPVTQDVTLFSGTIEENISLGLDLTGDEIMEAAKTVHAHEFIAGLTEGYKTVLSERASNISTGQRQLISFARVIAHNPRVVILDEATSSIDTETERLIQLGMKKVMAGRTSFVIAHRLSTIKDADRILVLSGGRLVEEGNHDELIAHKGIYAGLYRLQYDEEKKI